MRGTRPKPTTIKMLQGNPGKRRLRENGPRPSTSPELPEPPEHLTDEAKREWYRTGTKLAALGLLTEIDTPAFATYCCAWGRWVQAEEAIRATGPIVKAPHSGVPIQNPYLAIANRAMEQLTKALTEFGMTPSSRTRVDVMPPPSEENPFARLRREYESPRRSRGKAS